MAAEQTEQTEQTTGWETQSQELSRRIDVLNGEDKQLRQETQDIHDEIRRDRERMEDPQYFGNDIKKHRMTGKIKD
jgi:septal ring factor EnvC (AmiA/AmiB activator)